MKTKKLNTQAEDILSDEKMSDDIVNGFLDDEQKTSAEFLLAGDIRKAISSKKNIFDPEQKNILDQRIIQSINKSKKNKTIALSGSAAAILILLGLSIIFKVIDQSEIKRYAMEGSFPSEQEKTTLLLPGQKEIKIESQESVIEYSANGNEIKIDEQSNIEQPEIEDNNKYNSVIVPYGKRSKITLPDNSIVWLNSGSRLIYPIKFNPEKREVFLEGEAMFVVSHNENRPFFVLTPNLDIKVLGTSFNVSAYSDEEYVSTVLENGSVEIKYTGNILNFQRTEIMTPGNLANYNIAEKSITQSRVNPKNYTSWKDGYVILEQSSLESIAKKLSRYYNVSIKFIDPEISKETFSGYLDLRNSAIQVLEIIAEIVDIEVTPVNNSISIRKKQDSPEI